MPTKEELLAAFDDNPDICDLGYEFAELDRRGYCLWVIDCVKHVLPLAERHVSNQDYSRLTEALSAAERFVAGDGDEDEIKSLAEIPKQVDDAYLEANGETPLHLAETLGAIGEAIELTLPNSNVCHEDVIYATARAAFDGDLHDDDASDTLEPSDCNDEDELAGSEESEKEVKWQLHALKARLLNSAA